MNQPQIINENLNSLSAAANPNRENFQFIITGNIITEMDNNYLVTPDGRQFKVKRIVSDLGSVTGGFWQVEPTIDNLGKIVNLVIEKRLDSKEFLIKPFNLVIFEGRVVQLSKKAGGVIVKVKRGTKKTLKITLLEATKDIKVGQLWKFIAVLKEDSLYIKEATYLKG